MTIKLTDSTLKRSLEADGLKRLYFVAGNDAFLVSRCVAAVAAAVGGETASLDFCSASAEEAEEQLSTYSFSPKLLVLENFKASAYTSELQKLYAPLLRELPDTLTVAVKLLSEDGRFSLPKSAEAFAALCPDSAIVLCARKTGSDLVRYTEALAKRAGCGLAAGAAEELIRLCGDDLLALSTEVEKLAGAANYGAVTVELIRRMCPKTTEENVFDFVRAMERGRTDEAVRLLYAMLEQEQEPQLVFGAISSSFVNLARAKAAKRAGKSRRDVEQTFGYSKDNRALSLAFDRESRYGERQLDAIIACLADTDLALKSGAGDRQTLLEQGMVRLALLVSGSICA